jgi:hypothetical protein
LLGGELPPEDLAHKKPKIMDIAEIRHKYHTAAARQAQL